MQWKNHRLTTFAVTYALTGSFPATAIATASSMLPDVLELKLVKHRTVTHYPWIVLVPVLLMWDAMHKSPNYLLYVTFFVLFGYLCHLGEDFLSKSGIPLWAPSGKHFGCSLYVTHAASERGVALTIVGASVIYSWSHGLLTQAYLMQAANNMAILLMAMAKHFSYH